MSELVVREMRDAEYAPYRAQPAKAIVGQWVVMGQLSNRYTILQFQGTQRECEAVCHALNSLAEDRRGLTGEQKP